MALVIDESAKTILVIIGLVIAITVIWFIYSQIKAATSESEKIISSPTTPLAKLFNSNIKLWY